MQALENFINVSISAVAQELVVNAPARGNRTITSFTTTGKLQSVRVGLLVLPVVTILLVMAFLILWSRLLHRKHKIPIMRLATLSEILKSCQTAYIAHEAAADSLHLHRPSRLENLKVMYGRTTGMDTSESIVAGLGCKVERFR
jgi:hypothetical protein